MNKSLRIFNYLCGAFSRESFKDNLFRNRFLYDQVLLFHSQNEARNFQNSTFKPTAATLLQTFPTLCDELTFNLGLPIDNNSVLDHLRLVMEYNVPHGKLIRAVVVLEMVAHLHPRVAPFQAPGPSTLPADFSHAINEASVLGWCIEFLQASLLVLDDLMDHSELRRGRPCWYRVLDAGGVTAQGNVPLTSWRLPPHATGIMGINDGMFLERCIFVLLAKHFSSSQSYSRLVDIFNEVILNTVLGQCYDMTSERPAQRRAAPSRAGSADAGHSRFAGFSEEHYWALVRNKTAHYTCWLPVASALLALDVGTPALLGAMREPLLRLGELFQAQDDALDCWSPPEVIGKDGGDIREGKCTWPLVQALARASADQRDRLEMHYGRADQQSVAAVKAVYDELGLYAQFKQFEQRAFAELRAQIAALPEHMLALGLSREERVATLLVPLLNAFVDKLVGRKK